MKNKKINPGLYISIFTKMDKNENGIPTYNIYQGDVLYSNNDSIYIQVGTVNEYTHYESKTEEKEMMVKLIVNLMKKK